MVFELLIVYLDKREILIHVVFHVPRVGKPELASAVSNAGGLGKAPYGQSLSKALMLF
jgi:hypothetical protein